MDQPTYKHHRGDEALAMLPELTDLYVEVHSEVPEDDDPLFSREQFVERTENQAVRSGFEMVTVRTSGRLEGFSFGFPMPAGDWWSGATEPPESVHRATKFAVIELNVRRECRGRGWGRALLDDLLKPRSEEYATLATIPGSFAHSMYLRWGWYKVAEFHDDGPAMDAIVLPINAS